MPIQFPLLCMNWDIVIVPRRCLTDVIKNGNSASVIEYSVCRGVARGRGEPTVQPPRAAESKGRQNKCSRRRKCDACAQKLLRHSDKGKCSKVLWLFKVHNMLEASIVVTRHGRQVPSYVTVCRFVCFWRDSPPPSGPRPPHSRGF